MAWLAPGTSEVTSAWQRIQTDGLVLFS